MLNLPAPAKLNLFLHVRGRRNDGYHELETVFQLIDLCDRVELHPAPAGVLELLQDSDGPARDNLAVRAAQAFEAAARAAGVPPDSGVRIRLRKAIPAGGGLGGGSSDAATVLLGLERLWQRRLGVELLAQAGLALGADVPVFVRGVSAFGRGRGEQLTPVPDLEPPGTAYVVVAPPCEVSTAAIFGDPGLTRNTPGLKIRDLFRPAGLSLLRNDCQPVAETRFPPIAAALGALDRIAQPGEWARMTGTGASVFLRVASSERAAQVAAVLRSRHPDIGRVFPVRGLATSPVMAALA